MKLRNTSKLVIYQTSCPKNWGSQDSQSQDHVQSLLCRHWWLPYAHSISPLLPSHGILALGLHLFSCPLSQCLSCLIKDPVTLMVNVWAHWHPHSLICARSFFSLQDIPLFCPFDTSSKVSCLHFPLAHLPGLPFIAIALREKEKSPTKSENTTSQMSVPS